MFSMDEDEEGLDLEAYESDQMNDNYSYTQSAQTREAVVRTRKKPSVSGAKGSDNNKSVRSGKKTPKQKA